MSVTLHAKETGATIRCNRCRVVAITTGQIRVKVIRQYAETLGWIRGLRASKWIPPGSEFRLAANRRHDICPTCAPAEYEEFDLRRRLDAERRAKRTEKRQAAKVAA